MPAPLVARTPSDPDALAASLAQFAALGRALPASALESFTFPAFTGDGSEIGRILPGVGLSIGVSLRRLGIRRPVPGVLEPAVWQRALAWSGGRPAIAAAVAGVAAGLAGWQGDAALGPLLVGALTSYDSMISAIGNGRSHLVLAAIAQQQVTINNEGVWAFPFDLFRPSPFVFSSALAASAPGRASAGAINGYFPAPSGGERPVVHAVAELGRISNNIGRYSALLLVDVLYECGGIAFASGVQTLGTAALTRYTSGLGVFPALVTTDPTSNLNSTATVLYTNSAGTGSRSTTIAHPSSFYGATGFLRPAPSPSPFFGLAAGDVGVRSVQSIEWSAGGTGEFGLLLARPLAVIGGSYPTPARWTDFGTTGGGPVAFEPEACLSLIGLCARAGSSRRFDALLGFRFSSV